MKAKGFTLIEVMIVISILGILIAIILPTARDATVRNCLKYSNCDSDQLKYYYNNKERIDKSLGNTTPEQIVAEKVEDPAVVPTSTEKAVCIDGFKFVYNKQLIDNYGNGVSCEQ